MKIIEIKNGNKGELIFINKKLNYRLDKQEENRADPEALSCEVPK